MTSNYEQVSRQSSENLYVFLIKTTVPYVDQKWKHQSTCMTPQRSILTLKSAFLWKFQFSDSDIRFFISNIPRLYDI